MLRRTKIVTTLGPATDKEGRLKALLQAGANVVRLNFSHGSAEDHQKRASQVRQLAKELGMHIAILGDLQGPKIRTSTFEHGAVELIVGQAFVLDSEMPEGAGNLDGVGLDYKALPQDVEPDDVLLLDDGRVQLKVISIEKSRVVTEVTVGGKLSNNKGINKKGGGLSAAALTEKDKQDMHTAAAIGVDYLAISFPRNGEDMRYARKLATEAGLQAKLVAKVERAETVATDESIDEIIEASDAIMVARGDLGVEIGDSELVGVQKRLIQRARRLDRVVITATQMMESMIHAPMPTRAEVMDVANAVLDGTDAVMLSGETAAGSYPVETVCSMAEVCCGAERQSNVNRVNYRVAKKFETISETVAKATMFAANHMENMKAIIALTETGSTPLQMSRISSGLPIFAMSRQQDALTRVALYRGVYPVFFDFTHDNIITVAHAAMNCLKQEGYLETGDLIILTHGDELDLTGHTNTFKILVVS
ncbi:MAG: pyruvate kinase [Oleiphilus sp.]|nr:MAG: pyruvate kinase [Oleiphilus sp.]